MYSNTGQQVGLEPVPQYYGNVVAVTPQPTVVYAQPQYLTTSTTILAPTSSPGGAPMIFFLLGFCFGGLPCWFMGAFWTCSANREDRSWGVVNLVFTILVTIGLVIFLILFFGILRAGCC